MKVKKVISSYASMLSSAWIQLELEAFQLDLARLVGFLAQVVLQKIWQIELFVLFIVWFPSYGYFIFQLQSCEIFEEFTSDLVNHFQKITLGTCMCYKFNKYYFCKENFLKKV